MSIGWHFARREKGTPGGVPTLDEPRGYNFEVDHEYFQQVASPALAARFPQFERTRGKRTMSALYGQNAFDATQIIVSWPGKPDNLYLIAGFSRKGLLFMPATGGYRD